MIKKLVIFFGIVVIVGVAVWIYFSPVASTPIGNILKNPRDYAGKTLIISGQVTDRMSLLLLKYYRLKDDTGEIIVISKRPLPVVGKKIKVKGRVEEAFSLLDKQVLVFIEEPQGKGKS
jgi:hypothetical protein